MMADSFIPLSKREQGVTEMPLHSLIPQGVVARLQAFVRSSLTTKGERGRRTTYRTQVVRQVESSLNVTNPAPSNTTDVNVVETLVMRVKADCEMALDVLDAFAWYGLRSAESLNRCFAESNMNWKASVPPTIERNKHVAGGYRLQRRVGRESEEALESLPPSNATDHLRHAWHAVYGREPNFQFAYSEAIYAIEAAARPFVSPNDTQATLGRMIGSMRAGNPTLLSRAGLSATSGTTDAELAVEAMGALWNTQRRHGSEDRNLDYPATEHEAEMAVHKALWLVHGFQSGLLHT